MNKLSSAIKSFGKQIYYKYIDPFDNSEKYWMKRYDRGGNSGLGSYGDLAQFKSDVINNFVLENNIESVIEFGCGDGNQLALANYKNYVGYDISQKAIDMCRKEFGEDKSKKFELVDYYNGEMVQLTLSLDVIYHLVEDQVFWEYMTRLFDASSDYVIIYSSNFESIDCETPPHVRHRKFSDWVKTEMPLWELKNHVPNKYPYVGDSSNGSLSDFYIYVKKTGNLKMSEN